MPRRLLVRLDTSPLPQTDSVRLALEWEVIDMLAAHAPTVRATPAARCIGSA